MSIDRRFLDVSVSVLKVASTPGENPAAGDQYIVGSAPSGDFAGANANDVARYDGTNWRFTPPSATQLELLNLDTGKFMRFSGSAWEEIASLGEQNMLPVLAFVKPVETTPLMCDTVGARFLNTTEKKVYLCTAVNTIDNGVKIKEGDLYVGTEDNKLYTVDSTGELVSSTLPDGAIFLCKSDGYTYAYNATTDTLSRIGAVDEIVTESHALTSSEATVRSFTLSNSVKTGKEASVLLSVCGVAQAAGTDFTVSGSTLSWSDKALANIALAEGDVFVISYTVAAA